MTTNHASAPDHAADRAQELRDIFTTALEGGIDYWARLIQYRNRDGQPPRATIREYEHPDGPGPGPLLIIDTAVIERGLLRLAAGTCPVGGRPMEPAAIRKWAGVHRLPDAGELDANDADVIVQAGLFHEVRYG